MRHIYMDPMNTISETQNPIPEKTHHIIQLWKQGWSQTRIATTLGCSRRTIYNHINRKVYVDSRRRGRPRGSRKLAPFMELLENRLQENPLVNLARVAEEMRVMGYRGGLSILREWRRNRLTSALPTTNQPESQNTPAPLEPGLAEDQIRSRPWKPTPRVLATAS